MSIVQDVPGELKQFARVFDSLCYRQGDYGRVYADFIEYWVGGMLFDGNKPLAESLQKRYKDDYKYFGELVREMILAYNSKLVLAERRWYDGLGTFYETITSRYKSSHLGQFFTPTEVVDLMSMLVVTEDKKTFCDCCSGSGRMALAAHATSVKIKTYCADLDPVCANMTAINMALHGCQGEVSCMNSLTLEWRYGYQVNPYFRIAGCPPIPHLTPVEKFEYSIFFPRPREKQTTEAAPEPQPVAVQKALQRVQETGQLSLF